MQSLTNKNSSYKIIINTFWVYSITILGGESPRAKVPSAIQNTAYSYVPGSASSLTLSFNFFPSFKNFV